MLPVCSLFLSFSSCGSFAQQMLDNFTSNFTGTNSSTAKIGDNTNLTNAADYRKPSVNKNTPIATVSYMGGVYDVYSDHHAELKSVQLLYKQFIKLVIPSELNYDYETYKVTVVRAKACEGDDSQHSLRALIIGDNVREIGDRAFAGNAMLNDVVFNDNLEIIGDEAFSGCHSLTSVKMSGALRYIGKSAFSSYSNYLMSIDLSKADKLEYVGDGAFYRGNTSDKYPVSLPNSIKYIGKKAFYNSECVNIPENVEIIDEEGLPLKGATWILPISLKSVGKQAFGSRGWAEKSELIIPDGTMMKELNISYFPSCVLIKMGRGIKKVKGTVNYLKEKSNLRTIKLSPTLEEIDDNCFDGIEYLSSVMGLDDCDVLKRIGNRAFYGSNIEFITIPESVIEIGEQAFENSKKLRNVKFNGHPKVIKKGAFAYCPLLQQPSVPDGTILEKGVFFNP